MELLDIKLYPDAVLRQRCAAVESVTAAEEDFLDRMLRTMRKAGGIGLAAPQVGVAKKMFVADIGDGKAVKVINPAVVKTRGSGSMAEGCLSIPGTQVEVERAYEVVVTGLDEKGRPREWKAGDLLARVMLHEIDHLHGRLIIDYMNLFGRLAFRFLRHKGAGAWRRGVSAPRTARDRR